MRNQKTEALVKILVFDLLCTFETVYHDGEGESMSVSM